PAYGKAGHTRVVTYAWPIPDASARPASRCPTPTSARSRGAPITRKQLPERTQHHGHYGCTDTHQHNRVQVVLDTRDVAKKVTQGNETGDPNERTGDVVDLELDPVHMGHPRHKGGKGTEYGQKA